MFRKTTSSRRAGPPRPRNYLFRRAGLIVLSGFLSMGLVACERSTRRPPAPEVEITGSGRQAPIETEPKKILEQLEGSVHAKLDCADCHAPIDGSPGSVEDGGAEAGSVEKGPSGAAESASGGTAGASEAATGGGPEGDEQAEDEGADAAPLTAEYGKASCTGCHKQETIAYTKSIHAVAREKGKDEAATCEDCHGAHDTLSSSNPESRVARRNIPSTCGICHANPEVAKKMGIKNPEAVSHYAESIHGGGLVGQGLLAAPSCAECHGAAHNIYEADDERSTVHPSKVAATCGTCHQGARQDYEKSVHARAFAEGTSDSSEALDAEGNRPKPPTCADCHSPHEIVAPGVAAHMADSVVCGECHADRLERYRHTYHGQAEHLGDESVASCHDCHGAHAILSSSEPASRTSSQNRLNTCRDCHEGAPANFQSYMPHADHTDQKNYPRLYWVYIAMTGLLIGTFGFFGLHTLLWLARGLIIYFRDPVKFRAQKQKNRAEGKGVRLYRRFTPVDRFNHILVIFSFFLLVITGMPLKFHTTPWAQTFFEYLGGAESAGALHRFGAIVTGSYFLIHIVSMIRRLRASKERYLDQNGKFSLRKWLGVVFGPDSPVPRLQDLRDFVAHMKFFFGAGPQPKFDRFTYWEKFDYVAVFWGVAVIGMSGLVLWFPTTFTLVLPGWAINIAHIIHSDEALLAAGFIFTFHFFNSHFRPDKFPMDTVMFSGRITEEEFRHERPAQYQRLEDEGRLDEYLVHEGDWKDWRWLVIPFGAIAIVLGVLLAIAIFWSLAQH